MMPESQAAIPIKIMLESQIFDDLGMQNRHLSQDV